MTVDLPDGVVGTLRLMWVFAVEDWFDDPSDGAEAFRDLEAVGQHLFQVPDLLSYAREHLRRRGEVPDYAHPHPTPYELERAEQIVGSR
jgi:hypothetical protein